jgi:Dyp-type peroxidase family
MTGVDLSTTLAWRNAHGAALAMLRTLQPNILKSHIGKHLTLLLVRMHDPQHGRAFLSTLADPRRRLMKSALAHLEQERALREDGTPLTPYVGLGLSYSGYRALGVPDERIPTDPAFRRGMRSRSTIRKLKDPAVSTWQENYQQQIDAVVLAGSDSVEATGRVVTTVRKLAAPSVQVVGVEIGEVWRNRAGYVAEHFGYRDGLSAPHFLDDGSQGPRQGGWDARLSLGRVLVPDPSSESEPAVQHGSYLVLRKLEQNVRAFQKARRALAEVMGPKVSPEQAGAMLVGRFEDGTPLLRRRPGGEHRTDNTFTFADDVAGRLCPYPAHVRKMNPRDGGGTADRLHLMARRGITYGERGPEPAADGPLEEYPEGDVGLLFMAVNADLVNQFEFVQSRWANDHAGPQSFGRDSQGMDQTIGQGRRRRLTLPRGIDRPAIDTFDPIPPVVTMLGGEYFFLPSLTTLRVFAPS